MCDQRSSGVANLLIFLCVFILQSQILQYQNIRKQSTFKILLLGPEDSELIVKCGFFYFFCRRRRRRVELSDWLAALIITLFARGDYVWAKYSGQMTRANSGRTKCRRLKSALLA